MRRAKFCINSTWLGTVLAVLCGLATAQQALDLEGHAVDPFAAASGKPVVLIFLRRDCPVSGRYAPVIQKISRNTATGPLSGWYTPTRLTIRRRSANPSRTTDTSLPVLRDPEHALVKLSRVQITPEVAVFRPRSSTDL